MRKYRLRFLFIFLFSILCFFSFNNSSDSSSNTNDSEFGIKYSFYLSSTTDQPWASVSGLEGSVVPTVNSPEKRGYRFTGWKTKSGNSLPVVFGKDKLKFYAQWSDINTVKLIGSKSAPDTVGDIIFTDVSASPYPEDWNSLTEEQWKSAVAMLFTTTYNPTNGQNVKGGQYQYKIAAGLVPANNKEWCRDTMYYLWKDSTVEYAYQRLFTSLYIGYYYLDNYSYENTLNDLSKFVLPPPSPFSLSPYFGRQNLVDSKKFLNYAVENVAPAFEYAIHYGENQKMDSELKNDWYLPSTGELKILMQDVSLRNRYNRIIQKKAAVNGVASSAIPSIDENSYWTSSTDTSQGANDGDDDWIYRIQWASSETSDYWYYGFPSSKADQPDAKAVKGKILVFDPYKGEKGLMYIQINPHGISKKDQYLQGPESSELWETGGEKSPGYQFRYIFYNKAYKMNYKAEVVFEAKTSGLSVIPVRVF